MCYFSIVYLDWLVVMALRPFGYDVGWLQCEYNCIDPCINLYMTWIIIDGWVLQPIPQGFNKNKGYISFFRIRIIVWLMDSSIGFKSWKL